MRACDQGGMLGCDLRWPPTLSLSPARCSRGQRTAASISPRMDGQMCSDWMAVSMPGGGVAGSARPAPRRQPACLWHALQACLG